MQKDKTVACSILFTAMDGPTQLQPLMLTGLTVERALELRQMISRWLLRAPDVTAGSTIPATLNAATTGSGATLKP
jgi:hypothetical protein